MNRLKDSNTQGHSNIALWVFGYGSLIWRPAMAYECEYRATAKNWARRFWQGSHDHRGTVDSPGRVLTLVQLAGVVCEGRVFGISAEHVEQVLKDLDHREKNGYERQELLVETLELGQISVLTYIAAENNPAWLGEATIEDIAEQIRYAQGPSGSNKDYVLELYKALGTDGIEDEHITAVASDLQK